MKTHVSHILAKQAESFYQQLLYRVIYAHQYMHDNDWMLKRYARYLNIPWVLTGSHNASVMGK